MLSCRRHREVRIRATCVGPADLPSRLPAGLAVESMCEPMDVFCPHPSTAVYPNKSHISTRIDDRSAASNNFDLMAVMMTPVQLGLITARR